jgi:hypothetical protein
MLDNEQRLAQNRRKRLRWIEVHYERYGMRGLFARYRGGVLQAFCSDLQEITRRTLLRGPERVTVRDMLAIAVLTRLGDTTEWLLRRFVDPDDHYELEPWLLDEDDWE